jgi:predicted Rossmann-fold nucleotide-binding protein
VPSTALAEGTAGFRGDPHRSRSRPQRVTALAGDVVIAIGGGAGTLSEIAFA